MIRVKCDEFSSQYKTFLSSKTKNKKANKNNKNSIF